MKKSGSWCACIALSFAAIASTTPAALAQSVTVLDFEDLEEGFYDDPFTYQGITFSDVNNVDGSFPTGEQFVSEEWDTIVIEDATYFYETYPEWGSPKHVMTFGNAYVNGPNLSIGRLSSVLMDLDRPAQEAGFTMAFYENGPWGGIIFHLDALSNGEVVAADTLTISDLGGRDNDTLDSLHVAAESFDQLHFYATWGKDFSLPRVMIDNFTLTWADEPSCPADFNKDGARTVQDLLAYLSAFRARAEEADVDASGQINVQDLLGFLSIFRAGC